MAGIPLRINIDDSDVPGAGHDARRLIPGRPRIDATPITVRVPPAQLDTLDTWIADHSDPKPSRPEAIREALTEHLKAKGYLK